MKRRTIEITIKQGLREVVGDLATWTNPSTESDVFYPPQGEAKDFIKFRCYYMVKQLLNLMEQIEPEVENHHQRRKSDK